MKVTRIKGDKLVNASIKKYLINWDGKSPSKPQFQVKQFLKTYWKNCIVLEEFRIPGSLFRIDFLNVNKKLAVEVNGKQHETFNPFFHKGCRNNFLKSLKRDMEKRNWLDRNGFNLLEINCDEVKDLSRDFFLEKFGVIL